MESRMPEIDFSVVLTDVLVSDSPCTVIVTHKLIAS